MLKFTTGRNHVLFADNLLEAVSFVESTPANWNRRSSRSSGARKDWDLSAGWEGALRLAREGWEQGMRDMEFGAVSVVQHGAAKAHTYDVAGELPDMGRYCAGEPMHMRRTKRTVKPVVQLAYSMSTSASVSAQAFTRYGAAVVALVDQLETSGHRVELNAVIRSDHYGNGSSICGWRVKEAQDSLDLNAIAFGVAHPAAFRRIGFALWERTSAKLESSSGYGTPPVMTAEFAELIGCPDAVLLDGPGLTPSGLSTAQVNARLVANVEKALGIKILEDRT